MHLLLILPRKKFVNKNKHALIIKLQSILDEWMENYTNLYEYTLDEGLGEKIANQCLFIKDQDDLLNLFRIWDEDLADSILECINESAPILPL